VLVVGTVLARRKKHAAGPLEEIPLEEIPLEAPANPGHPVK